MAAVKTYQGVVDNGIIRLDPEIRRPDCGGAGFNLTCPGLVRSKTKLEAEFM